MVQMLSGLITYLLIAIYCRKNYNEKVNIKRVRELRTTIRNEMRTLVSCSQNTKTENSYNLYAKT